MKYLVISDIHGGVLGAGLISSLYDSVDKILILGDILYHGPRNDLPEDYAPKSVISILNPLKDKIIAIKGNCEAEVDQMVLDFKIEDYVDMDINGYNAHLEHGHHIDLYHGNANLILQGHTHIPVLEKINDVIYLNPGSITIPKGGNPKTYAIIDEKNIYLFDFSSKLLKKI